MLELAGAAGLLWTRTSPWAAAGLSALLVAMFPANVYKALTDPTIGFDDQLLPRTVLQVIFLAATLAVLAHHVRVRRLDRRAAATVPAGSPVGVAAR